MQFLSTLKLAFKSSTPKSGEQWSIQSSENQEQQVWRFWFLALVLVVLTALVLVRLFAYQVLGWENAAAQILPQLDRPGRGSIVDRDGELLAADRYFYQVTATANQIKTDADRISVAQTLETVVGLPANETFHILRESATDPYVMLAKSIDLDKGQQLIQYIARDVAKEGLSLLQNIDVRPLPMRFYPQNALASQVLGFVQANYHGVYGLEQYYDSFLDADGVGLLQKNLAPLSTLPPQLQRFLPSATSKDLVLTIDRTIQWIIEDELEQSVAKYRAQSGSIIVMEPKTGAVLGIASWPTYNPNQRGVGGVDFSRFSNPAVSAMYEPGSVFKVITMAAGLDTGVITPSMVFTDSGFIVVGQRPIFNSNRVAFGRVTVTEALARSLNVVTAQIAEGIGSEQFYRYIRRFGFGDLTEIDLANEVPGLLKAPGHVQWSLSDLGTNSFGQGLAVTPIQMATAVAAIANHGYLLQPYVVQARVEGLKVFYTTPTVVRSVIKPENAAALTQMMVETVETGNPAARVKGYLIAGKSGTAQVPGPDGYLEDETIVTFVGFAPADDPKFVLLVKLDQPDANISQWAGSTAAPVFSQVARRLFEHLNIPPDEIRLGRQGEPVVRDASQVGGER